MHNPTFLSNPNALNQPDIDNYQLNEDFKNGIEKLTLSQLLASITADVDAQSDPRITRFINLTAWINYIPHYYDPSNNRGFSQLTMEMAYCCHNIDQSLSDNDPIAIIWILHYLMLLIILVDNEQDLPEHHEKLLELRKRNPYPSKKDISILNCLLTEKILKKKNPQDPIVALHLSYLRTFIDRNKDCIEFINYKEETKDDKSDEFASIYFSSRECLKQIIDILLQTRQFAYLVELASSSSLGVIKDFIHLKLIKKCIEDEYQIEKPREKLHNIYFNEGYNDFVDISYGLAGFYYYSNSSLTSKLEELNNGIEEVYLQIPSYNNPSFSYETISDYFFFTKACRFFVVSDDHNLKVPENEQNTIAWIKCLNNPHLRYTGPAIMSHWISVSYCFLYHYPPIFKHVQRLASHERKLLDSRITIPIPFILRDYLKSSNLEAYQELYETFTKLNQNNEKRLHRNFDLFIMDNLIKFINLYEILEEKLFPFLHGFMATSPIPLIRFLDSFELIRDDFYVLIKEIISSYKNLNHRDMEDILLFINNLQNLSDVCQKLDTPDKEKFSLGQANGISILLLEKIKNRHFNEVREIFRNFIIELYCEKLEIICRESIDNMFATLSFSLLNQLLVGRKKMENNIYQRVFDEMLKVDLDPTRSFKTFTTDINQSSEIGKALAAHNNGIMTELMEKSIKIDLAFHYTQIQKFSYNGEGTLDINQILIAIWKDLRLIEIALPDLPSSKELEQLKKKLANFKQQITKGETKEISESNTRALEKMKSDANFNVLKKIIYSIATLKKHSVVYPNTFIEHIEHLEEHFKSLNEILTKSHAKKLKATQRFHIEQWDKNKITTLFLGNYLSCCLATNGSQFPAIVQRRMDKAMFMHVVIDEKIGEPVCGSWLFYATSDDENEVYVVANFFEIKSNYALKKELRDLLVSQLVDFTAQFTFAIGAKEFLIRPLTYGLIPDFCSLGFPTVTMKIKKVGGYLSLGTENEKSSQDRYYLQAVHLNQFYCYPKQRLQKQEEKDNYSVSSVKLFPPKVRKDQHITTHRNAHDDSSTSTVDNEVSDSYISKYQG